MSTSLAPRRLTIPAIRTDPRETLLTKTPFFLRDPAAPPATLPARQVSPPLLSFADDSFMDDFLAAVADPTKLPGLLAWRDWSEPPGAMLNTKGVPVYPASIARRVPLKIEPEDELPGTLDPDGVPHAAPGWLRKLYLPLHLRFNFIAFDVVCVRSGFPRLDKPRVLAAGAVLRRLVRDPASERWEDWLSGDGKTGLWFELQGGLPADPETIPAGAFRDRANAPQDVPIAARLGLPAPTGQAPLKLGLASTKLALLPPTAGDAAKHCAIYGMLPVLSAAHQANDDAPGLTEAQLAIAFHDHALAELTASWADDAGYRAALGPAVQTLLDQTVLPAPAGNAPAARNNIRLAALADDPLHPPNDAEIDAAIAAIAQAATRRYRVASMPAPGDAAPATSPSQFWTSAHSDQASQDVLLAPAGLNATRTSNAADWNVLVIDHVRATVQTVLATAGAPAGDAGLGQALLALSMIRLRRLRLALLAELHRQAFGTEAAADLAKIQPQTVRGKLYNVPAGTAGGLSSQIEALLGLDAIRLPPEDAPSWPPFNLTGPATRLALEAHQTGLALERIVTPVDAAGSGGGSAYETRVDTLLAAAAAALVGWFALPPTGVPATMGDPVWRLLECALEPREQPARGLLVFPGTAPSAATFTTIAADVANTYIANPATTAAEAKGHASVHRPRYDHDSLYAVWCWVRVAGRDDCENEQIIWTDRSEPFSIAEPTDILGAKPVTIQLPDLAKLIRDIPRIAKARAKPFAAFNTPPNSGYNVGDDPKNTSRAWGIGWICSFAIPVITICAFILFSIIFSILILLPSFTWMLLLKFCIPIPVPKKS